MTVFFRLGGRSAAPFRRIGMGGGGGPSYEKLNLFAVPKPISYAAMADGPNRLRRDRHGASISAAAVGLVVAWTE